MYKLDLLFFVKIKSRQRTCSQPEANQRQTKTKRGAVNARRRPKVVWPFDGGNDKL